MRRKKERYYERGGYHRGRKKETGWMHHERNDASQGKRGASSRIKKENKEIKIQ